MRLKIPLSRYLTRSTKPNAPKTMFTAGSMQSLQLDWSSECLLDALGHGLARLIPPPHHDERREGGEAREGGPAGEGIHIPCDTCD
jgi:hypothetical protein